MSEEALTTIINSYCDNEKGVRNLKRGMETVIAKLNIMRYLIPDKVELQEPELPKSKKSLKQNKKMIKKRMLHQRMIGKQKVNPLFMIVMV